MDDSTAFSPPSQDDNFFYIRYPKTTSRPQAQTNYHKIEKYTEAQQQAESVASSAAFGTPAIGREMNSNQAICCKFFN